MSIALLFFASFSTMSLIAHRGEADGVAENTMASYRLACSRGFGFECDVHLEADGTLAMYHVAGDRTADSPEFADVLKLAPRDGSRIVVDVKSGPEIVPALKAAFAAQTAANPSNVRFASMNADTCRELHRQFPDYDVLWTTWAKHGWWRTDPPLTADETIACLRELGARGVAIQYRPEVVTSEFIRQVAAAGFETHVWTVNDAETAAEALLRGATTVTTDAAKKLYDRMTRPCVSGRTDRDPLSYRAGETMRFTAGLRNVDLAEAAGWTMKWTRTGDDGRTESGECAATNGLVYSTSLDRPGFVRLLIEVFDGKGKKPRLHADLGAGVDVSAIRQAVPEPDDFDAFWARHKAELAKVPMTNVVRTKVSTGEIDVYAVEVPCAGGRPMTAFLSIPPWARKGKKLPVVLSFFGYGQSWSKGVTAAPTDKNLSWTEVELRVSAHGFELMKDAAYYKALRKASGSNGCDVGFDPVQNADPETSYFAGMTYRVMRALEFAKTLPEWNGKDLEVGGGSMGGLQSIWAAALDHDVTACSASIPWNCDIGGTEKGRNRGTWYVKWVPALGYYDAVNHAKRIPATCRVRIPHIGLGDYTCPPTGVFALYNALVAPKSARVFQNSEHGSPCEPLPRQMMELANP